MGNYLERQGLLIRDTENSYLDFPTPDDSAMDDLVGHSISHRIAVGPAGRRAFTLQTVPAWGQEEDQTLANASGFSLHAGIAAKAHQRDKLERLCRYIARPAVSTERLSLTPRTMSATRSRPRIGTAPHTSAWSPWISSLLRILRPRH